MSAERPEAVKVGDPIRDEAEALVIAKLRLLRDVFRFGDLEVAVVEGDVASGWIRARFKNPGFRQSASALDKAR